MSTICIAFLKTAKHLQELLKLYNIKMPLLNDILLEKI